MNVKILLLNGGKAYFLPSTPQVKQIVQAWLTDANSPRSVRALFEYMNGRYLNTPVETNEMININTPFDWQKFKKGEQCI